MTDLEEKNIEEGFDSVEEKTFGAAEEAAGADAEGSQTQTLNTEDVSFETEAEPVIADFSGIDADSIGAAEETESATEGDGIEASETGDSLEHANWFKKFIKAKKPSPLYYLREVLSYVLVFIIAIIIGLFINIYVVRLTRVNGNSMYPTLKSNQLLAASRLPVIFNDIHRGDVIIFDHTGEKRTFGKDFSEALNDNAITALFKKSKSQEEHTYYIKRVIGVKGDVIKVYKGNLYRTTLKNLGLEEYITIHTKYCSDRTNSDLEIQERVIRNKINNIIPDDTWELLDKESEPYINQDPQEELRYSDKEGQFWIVGDREFFAMGDNRNHSKDCRELGVMSIDCMVGKVLGKH